MRKKNALIPACLLLLLLAASCGETPAAPAPSSGTESLPATDPATEARSEEQTEPQTEPLSEAEPESLAPITVYPEPELPDQKYEGQSFRISSCWEPYETFVSESLNGEIINDTIYNRNLLVQERFGVTVEEVISESTDADLAKISMSGDSSFDATFGVAAHIAVDSTTGYALDLVTLPYVDFSQGYWYPSTMETLSCFGRVFLCPTDITPSVLKWTFVVFFNKRILSDFDLESPYQMVDENRWTLENYMGMIRQVSKDLNGDGVMDQNDLYGISTFEGTTIGTFMELLFGTGERVTALAEDGSRVIALNGDRVQQIIDKTRDVLLDPNLALDNALYKDSTWPNQEDGPFFEEGHALFEQYAIAFMQGTGREMEDDFGVAPNPKFDEEQEGYYHRGWNLSGMFAIPSCVADPEKTGTIFTYLTWLSNQTLLPAFFDVTIQQKRTRDEDSLRMLELVRNSVYFDFADVYDNLNITNYIWNAFQAGSYSRVFDGSMKKMNKAIDRLMKTLKDIE